MRKTNRLLFYEFFIKSFNEGKSHDKNETSFSTIREFTYHNEDELGFYLKDDFLCYYNENQKLDKIECFGLNLEINFSTNFKYDDKNRLISQNGWNKDNDETFEYQVIYNDEAQSIEVNYLINGQLEDTRLAIFEGEKKMWDQFKDANYELITSYEYNHLKQLTESHEFTNKQLTIIINYFYHENGLLEKREDRNRENEIYSSVCYQYDENKKIKYAIYKRPHQKDDLVTLFEYDNCNNIIRTCTSEGLVEKKRREIIYDTYGNLNKETFWIDGKLHSIKERQIKYL